MKEKILAAFLFFLPVHSFCCTSVIVSGKHTATGRPVMMKHRDAGELNNRIARFNGQFYDFIGLVNSPSEGGEVWTGTNTAGFSIMNTATYDLKDDDVPQELMDKEGLVMYRALEICASLADFEHYLDTLARPMGIEANFGVIDAAGGAAYYEVNNSTWVKFDVNDPDVAPQGWTVVTNFTRTGRPEDRKGVDRYEKATGIMQEIFSEPRPAVDHSLLLDRISRSGAPVLRDITSASIIIEGVRPGEDPLHTVMWTCLGRPDATIALPLMVLRDNHLPSYVMSTLPSGSGNALMCDEALNRKGGDWSYEISQAEGRVDKNFSELFGKWTEGEMGERRFVRSYDKLCKKIFSIYRRYFHI